MRIGTAGVLLLVLCCAARATAAREIVGRVVDDQGKPVPGAALDFFWSANGPLLDRDGKPTESAARSTKEAQQRYWSRFGQMDPIVKTTSDADGRFLIEARGSLYTLMAMDVQRTRGGLANIPKDHDGSDIEIRLRPLVRVHGTIEGPQPGHRPQQAMVITEVPQDPTRPLHMNRLVIAEAREAQFSMSLPPGRYVLHAYDGEDRGELRKGIVVSSNTPDVDLGILKLLPAEPGIKDRIKQSQARGAMSDYTKRYGEKLPAWHVTEARGVSADVQLADFEGKWVLINFWSLNCGSCLKHDLPRLARFYEEHRQQREQFEILAICVDCNGRLNSLAEVDRELAPIVEHVWDGKPIPFPVLLDPSMTTLERYGVPGYFTLLVDPDGRLVEGDETVLAEKLNK